ncbi:MAG: Rho termination factor N-terminal domain-containing protein [Actinomycetota bacterium]
MDRTERSNRIRANLGIEPIIHGQVYTFQVAIPSSQQQEIPLEKRQLLEETLTQHKTNLISLIVRKTDSYSEEEEYEVVYGADWCLVAKELEIEKLWVWVFDMNDEQAAAAKAEMEQLVGSTIIPLSPPSPSDGISDLKNLIQKLEKNLLQKIENIANQVEQLKQARITNEVEAILKQQQESFVKIIEELLKSQPPIKQQKASNELAKQVTSTGRKNYKNLTVPELRQLATEKNINIPSRMRKPEIIAALEKADGG